MTKIKNITFLLFLVFNAFTLSITAQTIIDDVIKVADKIINETSFQLYPKLQKGNEHIQVINLHNTISGKIIYAKSFIISDEKSSYTFGVSSESSIKIWVNGELTFHSDRPIPGFKTIAYDMYEFNSYFNINLNKGENTILLKTLTGEKGYFALGAIDEHGMNIVNIKFDLPYFSDQNHNWAFLGPLNQDGIIDIDETFPPEETLKQNYEINNEFYSWYFPVDNIILDDVIEENNSFTKHSYFEWHYANGQMMLGILALGDLTGETKYFNHVKKFCDFTLDNFDYFKYQYEVLNKLNGFNHRLYRRIMLDDTGAPALPFIELHNRGNLEEARPIIDTIAEQVSNGQVRLTDGTLARPEPRKFTVWADDLFMSVPFLLRYAKLTNDEKYYDDAADQVILFYEKLFDPEVNLYYHGWFSDNGENSVAHWGRANGWVIWAITEALLYLPKEHNDYSKILDIYKNHIQGLIPFQNENGRWHQVIDKPDSYEETSSTAMFTLAIARGVLNNWLDESYTQYAIKGWNGIADKIKDDGTVEGICRGTGIGFDLEFYFNRETPDNDPRGLGAVLTAGVEVSKLIDK